MSVAVVATAVLLSFEATLPSLARSRRRDSRRASAAVPLALHSGIEINNGDEYPLLNKVACDMRGVE